MNHTPQYESRLKRTIGTFSTCIPNSILTQNQYLQNHLMIISELRLSRIYQALPKQ